MRNGPVPIFVLFYQESCYQVKHLIVISIVEMQKRVKKNEIVGTFEKMQIVMSSELRGILLSLMQKHRVQQK